MKVGILNFSDIHMSEKFDNSVLIKVNQISSALKNRLCLIDKLIILVSGDTAFAGKSEEYDIAFEFFEDLIDKLNVEKQIIDYLFIPGNHDCLFVDEKKSTREALINSIDENVEIDDDRLEQIIVQKDYNEFKDLMELDNINTNIINQNKFYENVIYSIDSQTTLTFHLFNTAWISKRNEEAGQMYFPKEVLESLAKSQDSFINISVLHHPTHWCEPNNKRVFEEKLQEISDIIITGHEHANNNGSKKDTYGETIFLEGCVLQETFKPDKSEFNYIEIDTEESDLKLNQFDYNCKKKMYYPREQKYNLSTMKRQIIQGSRDQFLLNDEFLDFYNNLGAPIDHPDKGRLFLNDIYVYPDLSEILTEEIENKEEDSKEILERMEESKKFIYIFQGDKEFGKSSLLKNIAWKSHKEKIAPLYIDAGILGKKDLGKIDKVIKTKVREQFEGDIYEEFVQLDKNQKIVLIDDWNLVNLNKDGKNRLLMELCVYFDKVVLSSQNTTMDIKDTLSIIDGQDREVRVFNIKKFGYKKRAKLVEQWLNLSNIYDIEESEDYVLRFDGYIKSLNEIVGKNYIPQVPLYLLIILQSMDSGKNSVDFDKQTNGYYYELLIKQLIYDIELGSDDIGILNNYLNHLAYYIFKSKKNEIDYREFKQFYEDFILHFKIDGRHFRFERTLDKLEKANIIKSRENGYFFQYKYVMYYFVAQYISENVNSKKKNMNKKDTKEDIVYLIENINVDLNSNILIFLIHLSKEEIIFDEVIEQSEKILANESLMDINGDLNNLIEKLPTMVIDSKATAMENREVMYKAKDISDEEIEKKISSMEEKDYDLEVYKNPLIIEFEKAQKFSEVIGQILKNYGGTIDGETKETLLDSAYTVSLKAGKILSDFVIDEKDDLINFLVNSLTEIQEKEQVSQSNLENIARKMVFDFVGLLYSSIIQKAVVDTGTKRMKSTYEDYLKEEKNTAVKLIIAGSLLENTYLDESEKYISELYEYSENNYMVKSIVRNMVGKHLYMFDIPFHRRQQICKTYDIKYDPSLNKTRQIRS